MTVIWATHRLSGIATPANAAYSVSELIHQLKSSGAKILFTCIPLLDVALKAAAEVGISPDNVYLLDVPGDKEGLRTIKGLRWVDDLIEAGNTLPDLDPIVWKTGQGSRQVALLSFSSGTSGLPVREASQNLYPNFPKLKSLNPSFRKVL